MSDEVFGVVVVGAGLMGSAAARHASLIPGTSVCLVGPEEPKSQQDREGRDIFGCWYDEGRVYRRVANINTWAILATQAVSRYQEIEQASGIKFYTQVGYVHATKDPAEFRSLLRCSDELGLGAEDITEDWKERYPYFNFDNDCYVFLERVAGHISPRKLVEAQQVAATRNGAKVVRDVATTIRPSLEPSHRWEVVTEGGLVLRGRAVVVTVGGSCALRPLFQHVAPPRCVPDIQLKAQTVTLLRIPEEEAMRLKDCPCFTTDQWWNDMDGGYALAPILYPDGHWYVKMGHNWRHQDDLDPSEVQDYYIRRRGVEPCVGKLGGFLQHLLPDVKVEEVKGEGCMTSHTPHMQPYIDLIAEGFGVSLGGNRWAAKSSDEFGRLVARLTVLGEWESDIPRHRVKMMWKNDSRRETAKL